MEEYQKFKIREIQLADKPAMDCLLHTLNLSDKLEYSVSDQWFAHVIKTKSGGIFGADNGQELIGMATCMLSPQGQESATINVVTHPKYRNRGVGAQLYERAQLYAVKQKVRWAQASVRERIAGAFSFAEKRGFVPVLFSWHLELQTAKVKSKNISSTEKVRTAIQQDGFIYASLLEDAFGEKVSTDALTTMLQDPSINVLILESYGEAIGMAAVQIRKSADTGYIYDVAITSQKRGQGLGTTLLKRCLAHIKNKGMGKAFLQVAGRNERALSLYQRLGFKKVDTDIIMEKVFTV